MSELFEIKDWLLGTGPIRSNIKCCMCTKLSCFVPVDPDDVDCPCYCEDHYPWKDTKQPFDNHSPGS